MSVHVFPARYSVLVLLMLQIGVMDVCAFNPDSYKPYQWDWEAQTFFIIYQGYHVQII